MRRKPPEPARAGKKRGVRPEDNPEDTDKEHNRPIKKLNIPAAFDRISEPWSPHIAARVNGQEVRLAKIEGAFDWHHHDGVDELFFVVKGCFTMRFRDQDISMEEGDMLVVPANTEHMPVAEQECWIMLVEDAGTRNTGEIISVRTKTDLPAL